MCYLPTDGNIQVNEYWFTQTFIWHRKLCSKTVFHFRMGDNGSTASCRLLLSWFGRLVSRPWMVHRMAGILYNQSSPQNLAVKWSHMAPQPKPLTRLTDKSFYSSQYEQCASETRELYNLIDYLCPLIDFLALFACVCWLCYILTADCFRCNVTLCIFQVWRQMESTESVAI